MCTQNRKKIRKEENIEKKWTHPFHHPGSLAYPVVRLKCVSLYFAEEEEMWHQKTLRSMFQLFRILKSTFWNQEKWRESECLFWKRELFSHWCHSWHSFGPFAGWLSRSVSMTSLSLVTVPENSSSSPAVTVWLRLLWATVVRPSAGCSPQSQRASLSVLFTGSLLIFRWNTQRYGCCCRVDKRQKQCYSWYIGPRHNSMV